MFPIFPGSICKVLWVVCSGGGVSPLPHPDLKVGLHLATPTHSKGRGMGKNTLP